MIRRKIDRDWSESGDRVTLFMRRIETTLKEIALLRTKLHGKWRSSKHPTLGDTLVTSYQAALVSDSGIAVLTAARKRLEASSNALAALSQNTKLARLLRAAQEADGVLQKTPSGPKLIAEWKNRKAKVEREIARLLPGHETVASVAPIKRQAITMALQESEVLAIILTSPSEVFGCLIHASGRITPWSVPVTLSEVEGALKAVRQGAEPVGGRWPRFPVRTSADLFQMIFGPVSAEITTAKKLIVVPDATLQAVPFGVLLTESPKTEPAAASEYRSPALKWLARSAAITVLPTVNALVTQRNSVVVPSATRPFGGIGNPLLASEGTGVRSFEFRGLFRNGPLADVDTLKSLVSLPETEQELRTIGSALGASPGDIFLGARATEPAIKAADLAKYRVLAFATHGLVAGQFGYGSEPGLVLTPPLKATREDDGLLTMSEIMSLKLDADLVILSACSTATSDGRPRAEGLSGLARAFFSAGARSLVVTHWTIPSTQAVTITTTMITERQKDPIIDWSVALQRSVVNLMDNEGEPINAHPASWGAFAIVGVLGSRQSKNGVPTMLTNTPQLSTKPQDESARAFPSFVPKGWNATIDQGVATSQPTGAAKVQPQKPKQDARKAQPTPASAKAAKAEAGARSPAPTGAMLGISINNISGTSAGVVTMIVRGSPADKAGLRPGDVIMGARNEASGAMPKDITAMVLTEYFKRQRPGEKIRIWYGRNGIKYQTTVELQAWQ